MFRKAAESLREWHNKTEVMGTIDGEVAETLSRQYKITGFPRLRYFSKGEMEEYSGERTHQEIFNYMLHKHKIYHTLLRNQAEVH